MKRGERQLEKGAIDLIEEAMHLLRGAPLSVLAIYYMGTLPFILGLLYFWADMSRSPWAYQHLAGAALGLGALFVWMKLCQSIFAVHLRALMAGEPPSAMFHGRWRRTLVFQAALQSTGLFLLPLALVLTLPFAWVYAFYNNITALDNGERDSLRSLVSEAQNQAMLWPKQNHMVLAFILAFALFVFLNWTLLCALLPGLIKTLLGVESMFSRSALSLLNTTFFAIMFGLTYLCVDPIFKAIFALRCFYGQSRQSGEDLKAELKRHRLVVLPSVACVVFTLLLPSGSLKAAQAKVPGEYIHEEGHPRAVVSEGASAVLAFWPAVGAEGPEPVELENKIEQVLQQQKYTWRMPREKLEEPETNKGLLGRFFERIRSWLRSVRDWVIELVRKLFRDRARRGAGASSGYGWMLTLQLVLYLLAVLVVSALGILIWRIVRGKRSKQAIVTSAAIQPVPDLRDENVGPEQLPEDGWSQLGRELLERGELRLALRAFYLASLSHLASRQLISLAKFKSNRDYERELSRRGHSLPRLLLIFTNNVQVFDRVWYGMHEINRELVQQFLSSVELMRSPE